VHKGVLSWKGHVTADTTVNKYLPMLMEAGKCLVEFFKLWYRDGIFACDVAEVKKS
jgi:hypothetical protein